MKQLGALFLLVVIAVKAAATGEDGEFVKTKGAQLTLNGIPFYANGFNAYWLMYFAADPSPSQRQKVSTVFQEARSHGLSIARTWAFNDAQDRALQISPGVYSESTFQQWITEMASYAKSIDGNHLLEVGLEGFYGKSESNKQQYNPNFQVGTDFIANNEIPEIDFATVHAYPDQWLTNSDDRSQQEFLNHWLERDQLYNTIYTAIYSSARAGGAAAGGMFWQLFTEGMDSFGDGYEVILSKNTSTVGIIADQSQKLNRISRMYAKLRNIQKWKRARNSTGN
ncbi:Mannan endo-1,4-beta-mannosidase 7 [Linum perenne]